MLFVVGWLLLLHQQAVVVQGHLKGSSSSPPITSSTTKSTNKMSKRIQSYHQHQFMAFQEDRLEIVPTIHKSPVEVQNAVSPLHPYSYASKTNYINNQCNIDQDVAEVTTVMTNTCLASATKSFRYSCDSKYFLGGLLYFLFLLLQFNS